MLIRRRLEERQKELHKLISPGRICTVLFWKAVSVPTLLQPRHNLKRLSKATNTDWLISSEIIFWKQKKTTPSLCSKFRCSTVLDGWEMIFPAHGAGRKSECWTVPELHGGTSHQMRRPTMRLILEIRDSS